MVINFYYFPQSKFLRNEEILLKKVAFYTLGCKVNQYESEAMCELFQKDGYEPVDFEEFSDVYVINTCTVTSMSDRKSRQIIRRAKKKNPHSIVVVTGCYAQVSPDEVKAIEGVNLVLGTKDRNKITELIKNISDTSQDCCVENISKNHEFEDMTISSYSERTRAFIKVQEGCNQFCSYCIIPYARGPIRSRNMEDVLDEAKKLINSGYKEIVLVGIHIASYGLDKKGYSLSDLIIKLDKIDGLERLRMSSIEPMTLNREFIEKIGSCKTICPHFHLSLQSGCDETLSRMNRKYTTAEYEEIVNTIRENFEDAAITTDIMTGFPGETDEEFNKTAAFTEKIAFADAHIFQYSRRKGTPADVMKNQISPEIKEKRSKVIEEITSKSRAEFLNSQLGKTVKVLFEQKCHDDDSYFEGKTPNYITVRVKCDKDINNQILDVNLVSSNGYYITGEFLKSPQF